MSRKILSGFLLLAMMLGCLQAAPPEPVLPLDLVPADACIAVAIRDLKDLKAKADKLLKGQRNLPRLSQVFDDLFKQMKLPWPIDEKASAALICATGPLGGFEAGANPTANFTISAAIPYSDRQSVLKGWKLAPQGIKDEQVEAIEGPRIIDNYFALKQMALRSGHAFMSNRKGAIEAWMKAKTIRETQPADRLKRLDTSDGLFYLGPPLFDAARIFGQFDPQWAPDHLTEREKEAHRRLNRALVETRTLLATYRLDEGLGVDMTLGFDPKGKESQQLLRSFDNKGLASGLNGLPAQEGVVAALSLGGVESGDLDVARLLATEFWLGWRTVPYLLESDAPAMRRVLGDLYARMKTLRGAAYLTREKGKVGPLAVVAVLEPKNLGTFVKELNQMARLADVKAFEPRGEAGKAEIAKLVADLGADDFDVREAATTKLALIGEPAMEALAKAEKSDDAEVRRRAEEIRTQYLRVAELRKQEVTRGLLKQAFHPQFSFKEKAEERSGVSVHHLGMAFDVENAPFAIWFKDLFGPDWNRIRLAIVGDKVVALFGSDVTLLDQAIENVRDGKLGLEQSPAQQAFRKQVGTNRRGELHVALRILQQLTTPADRLPKDFKPSATLSSVAFRTGKADFGVDFWVPADALEDGFYWFLR